jgi:ribosomal protein S18 acetylase RimI-like enzyme
LDDLLDLLPKCFAQEFEASGFDLEHARPLFNRAFGIKGRLFLGLSRLLGKERIKFLVAEDRNKLVGTTIVSRGEKVGYISLVMVHPDYRRRGIATRLVKRAIEYLHKREMERAVLNVVSTNAPAISVYSKLGFEEFERVANMFGDTNSISVREGANQFVIRPYQESDVDDVYSLIRASEDPKRLKVSGFSKKPLKSSFWQRLSGDPTPKRIVALDAGKIVGYASTAHFTEYGTRLAGLDDIRSIHIKPEDKTRGIERALIGAAIDEIRKGGAKRVRAMVPMTKEELLEALNDSGFKEAFTLVGMSKELRG